MWLRQQGMHHIMGTIFWSLIPSRSRRQCNKSHSRLEKHKVILRQRRRQQTTKPALEMLKDNCKLNVAAPLLRCLAQRALRWKPWAWALLCCQPQQGAHSHPQLWASACLPVKWAHRACLLWAGHLWALLKGNSETWEDGGGRLCLSVVVPWARELAASHKQRVTNIKSEDRGTHFSFTGTLQGHMYLVKGTKD